MINTVLYIINFKAKPINNKSKCGDISSREKVKLDFDSFTSICTTQFARKSFLKITHGFFPAVGVNRKIIL